MIEAEIFKIVDKFKAKDPFIKSAKIAGYFDGHILISFERNLSGHIGLPLFATIREDGHIAYLEGMRNILRAMHIEREYLHLD